MVTHLSNDLVGKDVHDAAVLERAVSLQSSDLPGIVYEDERVTRLAPDAQRMTPQDVATLFSGSPLHDPSQEADRPTRPRMLDGVPLVTR